MNNKGFAVTGIMYSVLIIFLIMMTSMLSNLQNRKTILDELKLDAVDAVESENNYNYLLSEINALKTQIGATDISTIGDGTITGNIDDLNSSSYEDITAEFSVDSTYISKFKAAKIGNIVLFSGYSNTEIDIANQFTTIITCNNEDLYPTVRPGIAISYNNKSDIAADITIRMDNDGKIQIYSPSAYTTNSSLMFSGHYFIS